MTKQDSERKIQVLTPEGWRWVFARNADTNEPTIVHDKDKALPYEPRNAAGDLEYLAGIMPRHVFRLAFELDSPNETAVFIKKQDRRLADSFFNQLATA